ncbi:thiolase family protein [Natranaerofaba carboxydovora]|uniref:thiolase family protein n=1 Tax=Natranaerofaba carboxydovora TaxID=2742683 RepID=UPI001F136A9C|nr:thiolase family protein [Natranaerofaba carboxydovora]UMZ73277.1 3-ketoacyl-CoA thiolase [Natranaerofaba carboxydovora]
MTEVVIATGARTPVGRAPKGTLSRERPEDLAALVIKEVVNRSGIDPVQVEDVILGCSFPEGEQGMNIGRVASTRAGLPNDVPGQTVNRFCSSGLQSISMAAERIMAGFADVIIAGGVESMSMVPMGGNKIAPNPGLIDNMPEAYITMGLTAEEVAKRYNISREEQDEFALASHQKAAKAIEEGKFEEECVPVEVNKRTVKNGKIKEEKIVFDKDEGVRPNTTLEKLGQLKPVFAKDGSVTPGNSSQINDAAAAVLVTTREKAEELGLTPLAIFKGFGIAGVDPDVMGIGPAKAIPKALELTGLSKDDIDLFELNEAFASQALYCINELGLDKDKVNVNGGAIALGHPLGCTGSKLTLTLLHELKRRGGRYGIVSMCIGGGMGAAGVFENCN